MTARRRQLVAVAALVAGLAAPVAAGVLFWNEWAALLVALVCLVIATWSAWFVLSRRGLTRLVAVVVLFGALVARWWHSSGTTASGASSWS